MRNKNRSTQCRPAGRIITRFGRAQLIRFHDGSVRLCGGGRQERTAAKEWVSLFMHEAVVPSEPRLSAGFASR
jgi:hypothetical protein